MHRAGIVYKQRNFYHLLKAPNYTALFISPDDYDITVNRKESANVLMFLMILHFTEVATGICSLRKCSPPAIKNSLVFSKTLTFDHN